MGIQNQSPPPFGGSYPLLGGVAPPAALIWEEAGKSKEKSTKNPRRPYPGPSVWGARPLARAPGFFFLFEAKKGPARRGPW